MYRKTVIDKIPTLAYLDDAPVFVEDRRRAEAYIRGGAAEERKEMDWIKKEKRAAHAENHNAFKDMIENIKREKAEKDGKEYIPWTTQTSMRPEEKVEPQTSQHEKKLTMKEMMAEAKSKKAAE